jgi:formate hydrogenlyase subunit 3/multisubunit Na+/H+ antiporter MnhD subunit
MLLKLKPRFWLFLALINVLLASFNIEYTLDYTSAFFNLVVAIFCSFWAVYLILESNKNENNKKTTAQHDHKDCCGVEEEKENK